MHRRLGAVALAAGVACCAPLAAAGDFDLDLGGRVRPQLILTTYPDDSAFEDVFGASSIDANLDARVVLGLRKDRWSLDVDYQFVAVYGDRLEFTRELPPELQLLYPHLPTDQTRLFDLTTVHHDSGKWAALSRLDRLALTYASDKVVVRFGRQAVSWGNGLIYTAMDIFNPFDPAAVDKEYKTGDDMLYGQFLRDNGHDLQSVAVFRRDLMTGEVEADVSSLAFKYHGLYGAGEYDLLAARHYGESLVGIGGNRALGGAVWHGDLVVTETGDDTVLSLVTGISYSWVWGGRNFSGAAEYFYNGFGQNDGCYSIACLEQNPELVERIARGEVFTLGRNYLGLSAVIEVSPLFLVTPNFFINVADPSALVQVLFQRDLRENLVLVSSVGIPVGANGTEFGGAATARDGLFLSSGVSVTVQLAWYW